MTRNTDLSTSTLVSRQLTENKDDMVDEEKDMSFDDLTNTGDYSDYDILEEEKDTIAKKMMSGSKQKHMEMKITVNSLQPKKRG